MKKKKEEKENPLHTEYGILSNSVYILGKIKKYCPKLLCRLYDPTSSKILLDGINIKEYCGLMLCS